MYILKKFNLYLLLSLIMLIGGIIIGTILSKWNFHLQTSINWEGISAISTTAAVIVSLYFGLRKPKTELQIDIQHLNQNGVEVYQSVGPKLERFEFTLFSGEIGWFKLQRVVVKDNGNIVKTIYDYNENIDELPGTSEFADLKSQIILNPYTPNKNISFNTDKLQIFREYFSKGIINGEKTLLPPIKKGDLYFIFQTNNGKIKIRFNPKRYD